MSRLDRRGLVPMLALMLGAVLLALTLQHTDFGAIGAVSWRLGAALPLALVPGAAWHVARTFAWRACFAPGTTITFARLFRIRLAAEAFSYLTIRGVAGEPLKVVLLRGRVPAASAAAAVALERIAYMVATTVVVGIAAAIAVVTLPLSPAWATTFRTLAMVVGGLIAGFIALMLRPEPPLSVPAAAPGSLPAAAPATGLRGIRRFGRELRLRWRELIYGDRERLATLAALEIVAYGLMALEVWIVLRAMDVPIGAAGALAIESLTRVASLLSAFIPGGLGSTEASNVVAATALHATAGAAALAIVRRLRGLLWCAAGLAIAPRPGAPAIDDTESPAASAGPPPGSSAAFPAARASTLVVIDSAESIAPEVRLTDRLGGLPLGERILRAAVAAGYRCLLIRSPRRRREWLALTEREGTPLAIGIIGASATWDRTPRGPESDGFDTAQVPRSRDALAAAERALRHSIVKPTDGRVARFNRRLSIPISVFLVRSLRFGANAMSLVVLALGLYAGWLFSRGDYATGVAAAAISLAAGILDGCDGELARLQYRQSAFGCWLDTIGDYVSYASTFAGLTIGAVRATGQPAYWWIGAALLGGSALTFALLILLRHRATRGRPELLNATTTAHFKAGGSWARLAAWLSICATRALMPYGILAFAIAGLLPILLVLAAVGANVYWISLAIELRRLLAQARRWEHPMTTGTPERAGAAAPAAGLS